MKFNLGKQKDNLAVALVFLLFFSFIGVFMVLPQAQATTMFSDSFESGTILTTDNPAGQWDSASGTPSIVTDSIYSENYAANFTDTEVGGTVLLSKNFGGTYTTVYAQATVYISSIGENYIDTVIALWDNAGITKANMGVKSDRTIQVGGTGFSTDYSTTKIELNNWYLFKIKVVVSDSGAGEARFYLNGTELTDVAQTGLTNDYYYPYCNVVKVGAGTAWNLTKIIVDSVIVSDTNIFEQPINDENFKLYNTSFETGSHLSDGTFDGGISSGGHPYDVQNSSAAYNGTWYVMANATNCEEFGRAKFYYNNNGSGVGSGLGTCYYHFAVSFRGDFSNNGSLVLGLIANVNDAEEIQVGIINIGTGLQWYVSSVENMAPLTYIPSPDWGGSYFVGLLLGGNPQTDTWYDVTLCTINYGVGQSNCSLWIDDEQLYTSNTQTILNAGYLESVVQSPSNYADWSNWEVRNDAWVITDNFTDTHLWTQNSELSNSYTLSLSVTNPQNTTYTSSSIPVQLSVGGNDTNKVTTWNAKFSNGTWLFGSNQTYTTSTTMTIPTNETDVLFCALAEGDNEKAYNEVYFSTNITERTSYSLSLSVTNPTNTTYTTSSIPVELSSSGNDTNIAITYNAKFSNGTWLYGANQTYTTATSMTIPTNETNVLFCAEAIGDNLKAYSEIYFSTNITEPQPTPTPTPTATPTVTPEGTPTAFAVTVAVASTAAVGGGIALYRYLKAKKTKSETI